MKRQAASIALAGWDPNVKDAEVEVECDPLTGGHYKACCTSTERAWIGLRGRPGVVTGAYCFEVKVTEGLLRVGWGSSTGSLALGVDDCSFGFGGTGKKSHKNKFVDYGCAFGAGDVVTCCIDRGKREVSFGVNGTWYGRAFPIPGTWDGVALFPALCAREAFRATGYFGCPDHPRVPHGVRGYWPLGDAHGHDVVESSKGPPQAQVLAGSQEEPQGKRQDRADRFAKMARVDRDLEKLSAYVPTAPEADQRARCRGAANGGSTASPLIGRSRALERGYLRDAAKLRDPDQIRPIPVLREALAHALQAGRPWAWEQEMLRAIRQDLTVQHAEPEAAPFAEEVCEVSAFRALANGDWPVFATCAPLVSARPRAPELAWLLQLGASQLARSSALSRFRRQPPQEAGEARSTAAFVRSVLRDMDAGCWTRALRRKPPTAPAEQAFNATVKPVAVAQALAVATKAFPKLRRGTLHALGVSGSLPPGVIAATHEDTVDGRRAHASALEHLASVAKKPTAHAREDHSVEFLR